MTTLSRPWLSAGSSVWTAGSGSGDELPGRRAGRPGLPDDDRLQARAVPGHEREVRVSVGLWAEKLHVVAVGPSGVVAGLRLVRRRSLYSAAIRGVASSAMSIIRTQPHGQPWSGSTPPSLP